MRGDMTAQKPPLRTLLQITLQRIVTYRHECIQFVISGIDSEINNFPTSHYTGYKYKYIYKQDSEGKCQDDDRATPQTQKQMSREGRPRLLYIQIMNCDTPVRVRVHTSYERGFPEVGLEHSVLDCLKKEKIEIDQNLHAGSSNGKRDALDLMVTAVAFLFCGSHVIAVRWERRRVKCTLTTTEVR